MTYQVMQCELVMDLTSGEYQINPISDPRIIGPVDYGWAKFVETSDVLTWGGGPLAGSRIPGTRRLVCCDYTPQAAKTGVMEK